MLGRDEVLGRQVALKRIGMLPGADTADLARAEREARLSARLNHQHVVSVFDFVVDADSDAAGSSWSTSTARLSPRSSGGAGRSRPTPRPRCSGRWPTRSSPPTRPASCTGT